MSTTAQIAKHFRDLHFGGNWTAVNLKETLEDVTWQQAFTKVHSFNSIATLVYHTNYYVNVVMKVLRNEPLHAKDTLSFDHPPFTTEEDWRNLLDKTWTEAAAFADYIEQMPEHQLWETFVHEKYGNYYRNLHGIIEHTHYHLGQILLLKKLLQEN